VSILKTHEIDVGLLQTNAFDTFFSDRRERLLKLIEVAMGKPASPRGYRAPRSR